MATGETVPLAATPDEVAALLSKSPRGAAYTIVERGATWLELRHEGGAVVLTWPALWGDRAALAPHLMRARTGYAPLVLLGSDGELQQHGAADLEDELDVAVELLPLSDVRLHLLLARARGVARLRRDAAEGELLADRYRYELDELNAIGRALSSQRDLDELLSLILEKARYVTGADAGSVFVVEKPEGRDAEDLSKGRLRFKVAQNDSVSLDFSETTLPVSPSSIVGRCVLSREVINIPDLYQLDDAGAGNNPWGFRHNRDFDTKIGYQTRSVLAVPMVDAHEQVIGVIQLINKKKRSEHRLAAPGDFTSKVVPFDPRSQELAATLASQAGISIENAILYGDIRNLFDGFVRASVIAIESRAPTRTP